jgi:hypothetical protein
MEQLVILVLIGLVSFINWLVKKSGEARAAKKLKDLQDRGGESYQAPAPTQQQQNRPVADESAETMRKFMEALGIPADQEQAPPPIPERRITLDPEVFAPQPPPPPVVRKRPEPIYTPPPVPAFVPTISVPEWREEGPSTAAPAHSWNEPSEEKPKPNRATELFSSRGGLRDAIIVSEVLGRPRALRPHEL